VTYVRLHILISVVSFIVIWVSVIAYSSLSLFYSFIHDIDYPVIFCYILSCYDICTHCLYARVLFLFLIYSLGHFWRSWICTSRLDTLFYCSGVGWDHICCEELESFSTQYWYSYSSCIPLFLWFFFDSCISILASILFFISCIFMCGHLYVVLQWSLIYYSLNL